MYAHSPPKKQNVGHSSLPSFNKRIREDDTAMAHSFCFHWYFRRHYLAHVIGYLCAADYSENRRNVEGFWSLEKEKVKIVRGKSVGDTDGGYSS